MKKYLLSIVLFALILINMLPLQAFAAGYKIDTFYSKGIVSVHGSGFAANIKYLVRIVNRKVNYAAALGNVTGASGGAIAIDITTGGLGKLSDYIVYVSDWRGVLKESCKIKD